MSPPRMRTIAKAIECLKAEDPGCCLTVSGLRRLVKRGKIRATAIGTRQLVNLDEVEEYLCSSAEPAEEVTTTGIRPVPERVYELPRQRAAR